ncbi:DNA-binding transcriptional LysR family regulator [Pseudorhizobium tarimense]|uniref:DNA-binding transcriptional LysR family regulator n=1 Tax=Pseudorhizobium tarimense TaxID=1079109 RepID=A0ABV2H0U1_9HYPH
MDDFRSAPLYRWEFERRGEESVVDVPGPLRLDSVEMMVVAAEKGLGLAYIPLIAAQDGLSAGRLKMALEDWCPPIDGLCL